MTRTSMRVGLTLGVMWLALGPIASLADGTNDKLKNIFQSVAALGSGARTGLTENFEAAATARWTVVQAGQSFKTANNVWQVESGSVDVVNARTMPSTVAYDGSQLIDLAGSPGLTVDAITIAETKDQPTASSVAAPAVAAAGQPEDKAAFSTRCKRETLAQSPTATAQVDSICSSRWDMVMATAPITDSVLALAPAPGASFDPVSAAGRLTTVRWAATPVTGQLKSGRLRDLDVGINSTPVPGATFSWFKNGEPIPFNLEEALKVRGATLSVIGCLSYGAAEGSRVYQVNAPGKAPFVLNVGFREAAMASQSSDYGVTADYGGQPPTLASLRKDGSEWTATCPQ